MYWLMIRRFISRVENDHDHKIQQLQPHPFSFRLFLLCINVNNVKKMCIYARYERLNTAHNFVKGLSYGQPGHFK